MKATILTFSGALLVLSAQVIIAAPSLLYLIWRQAGRNEICPMCRQPGMIPLNSPRTVEMRKGQ